MAEALLQKRTRDAAGEFGTVLGEHSSYDIGLPVGAMDDFASECRAALGDALPGCLSVYYGHIGDGNLHFNITQPSEMAPDTFLAHREEFNALIHALAEKYGGSFSAEHGIGLNKVGDLAHYRSEVELDLMTRIKQAFDPANIMNPGKVIDIG